MLKLPIKLSPLLVLLFLGALLATPFLVVADDDDETTTTDDETSTTDDETTTTDEGETSTSDDDEHDEFDEAENQEKDDAYERKLTINVDPDRVEIESQLKFGDNKDEFEIEFRAETGEEPEIELEYSTETDTLEAEFQFEVEFERIIEYVDNGTSDGYQVGEEVFIYEIGETDWNDIVHLVTTIDGSEVNIFTAMTTDGVFTIILKISGSITDLGNATLTPNSLKMDIEIHDFPYTSTDSKLAIKAKVETESESEQRDESTEETSGFGSEEAEIFIGNAAAQGFFSWAEYALADGSNVTVITSALTESDDPDEDLEEGKTSNTMYFSFNVTNSQDIVWDPKVGVQSQGTELGLIAIEEKYSSLRNTATASLASQSPTSPISGLPGFEFWLVLSMFALFQVSIRIKKRH
ncbi:MAG: hypothetical protein IH840_00580 [Candidatus Heimdallarchaeota archaeon]|nr:hypothetical protein [Candidatus Heimdallarchaeota archaeon]